jgi:hypothetical protein
VSSLFLFLGVYIDFSKKIKYFVVYNKAIYITRQVTGVQILLGISYITSINIIYASLFILVIVVLIISFASILVT